MKAIDENSDEKRTRIVNAAFKVFGSNSYAKASISDIAKEANVSKALIFHHFKTKKALYFYLMDYSYALFLETFKDLGVMEIDDFFQRIAVYSAAELEILRQHPFLFKYIMKFYYERDSEVLEGVLEVITKSKDTGMQMTLEGINLDKFKENIDLELLGKMIRWMGEGITNQFVAFDDEALDFLERELQSAMALLKQNVYKEAYL